ncbi:MAG TPA: hypothetical protein VK811_05115 [Candidatus Acidoferrum sp.]|nr:hypothetical protein [Candidatus Acidoferrum sp.]
MKNINGFLMAAICGIFPISTLAIPLDISFTGGTPVESWGINAYDDPGFADYIPVANGPESIDLAGVNSINMTWSAPAGYMYVVNPPPAGLAGNGAGLLFEAEYGSFGQASSLGSITASSFSVNTIYGTSPLTAQVLTYSPGGPALYFAAAGTVGAGSAPFAFTSITISADFSGIGTSTLSRSAFDQFAGSLGTYNGDFVIDGIGANGSNLYYVPADPGQLLTLEPLPTGSVPDAPSTCFLAGLSFAGFWLCGRKLSTGNS